MTYDLLENLARKEMLVVLVILALMTLICLIRAIKGPRTADRVVSVNMLGTIIIGMVLLLTVYLGEGYLADIALIYAMLSFLAVVVLTKVYMGVYKEKKEETDTETVEKEEEK